MSESTYILSVPETGTTREITGEQLRAELAGGQITSDYWIWSPENEDWKQISELPTLWVAPAPVAPAAIPVPVFRKLPTLQTAVIPAFGATTADRITPAAGNPLPVNAMPRIEPIITPVTAVRPVTKKNRSINTRSVHVDHDEGFPYVKFFFEALYIGIAVMIGLNYIVVDKPLNQTLANTPFVLVPVHAHMGSFVQPTAMVVHLLPTTELNNDNLPDFLQTLAESTPNQPFAEKPFEVIELTAGWVGQFSISGENWKKLGTMSKESASDRRDFITDSLCSVSGLPLIHHPERMGPLDLKAARDQTWQQLTAELLRKS